MDFYQIGKLALPIVSDLSPWGRWPCLLRLAWLLMRCFSPSDIIAFHPSSGRTT